MPERVKQTRPERIAASLCLLLAALALLFCASPASGAEGEVTLAVVAAEAELAPLGALLEVELSQGGLRLVERAALDSVLQEQEVSAAGLTERETLVRVGRLLRADAFLLLSLEEPPKKAGEEKRPGLLRVRLTETVHGIRLVDWYVPWDPDKVEQAAGEVAEKAAAAAAKLALPVGELTPVGIVDVHRVLLGDEHQWMCRALKGMLSSRLSKEPQIVVLEREDLKLLLEETELTAGEEGAFWRPGVLVEGTLQRAGVDGMELRLQVKRPGGEATEVGAIAVAAETMAQAAEQAAAGVLDGLTNAPPAGTWEPADEAQQFWRQGTLLMVHGRKQAAVPLLETALALEPGNVQYAVDLWSSAATRRPWPGGEPYTDLQEAELAGRLAALLQRRTAGGEWGQLALQLAYRLESHMTGQASTSSERVRELNRSTRARVVELKLARLTHLSEATGREELRPEYSAELLVMATSTPDEAVAAVRDFVRRKIMPPALGGTIASFPERCSTAILFTRGLDELLCHSRASHVFFDDYEFPNKLFPYFQEMAASADPLVRFCGCMLCTTKVRAPVGPSMPEWESPVDQDAYLDQAVEVFDKHLRAAPDVGELAARTIRTMLPQKVRRPRSSQDYLPSRSSKDYLPFLERFYVPLIEEGDVEGVMQWPVGVGTRVHNFSPQYGVSPEVSARYVALIDRAAEMLEPHAAREDVADRLAWLWYNSDWIKDGLRRHLRGRTPAEVLRYLPEFGRAPDRQVRVTMLVRQSDWFRAWGFNRPDDMCSQCVPQGQVLWVAFVDNEQDRTVGLVGIDLAARRTHALWQTIVQTRYIWGMSLAGVAVRPGSSYVAVSDIGLLEFPGSEATGSSFLTQPRVLGEKDGLPPGRVMGAAPEGDRLWIGYRGKGGSGLGLFEPQTGEWQTVLLSTERGETPLEAGSPYDPSAFLAVPEGLLFTASVLRDSPNLWLLRKGSRNPEGLCHVPPHRLGPLLVDAPGGPWFFDLSAVSRLAMEEGEIQVLLAGGDGYRDHEQREGQTLAVVRKPFVQGRAEANPELFPVSLGCIQGACAAVHGDELWAPYGETQIVILHRGKSMDEAEFIPNDILTGGRVFRFLSTPYGLVAIGNGTVGLVEPGP